MLQAFSALYSVFSMSNMSYCRFENTLRDLRDCFDAMNEEDIDELSQYEAEAKDTLIELCRTIIEYDDAWNED